jgi:hypothetical protein
VQLSCGIDLAALLRSSPEARSQAVRRLERFVERERLKGLSRHWTYDLNRHIALVQALDALSGPAGRSSPARGAQARPTNENGARWRRVRRPAE